MLPDPPSHTEIGCLCCCHLPQVPQVSVGLSPSISRCRVLANPSLSVLHRDWGSGSGLLPSRSTSAGFLLYSQFRDGGLPGYLPFSASFVGSSLPFTSVGFLTPGLVPRLGVWVNAIFRKVSRLFTFHSLLQGLRRSLPVSCRKLFTPILRCRSLPIVPERP